ncbi:MupA/Atu3671 family FMN-dependent luciferase-like monooxygenase [uncultured Tateyamaria sp.]|uniref:MupA/Atu3671 family FMN-dependent luciferase-like monooxygenase n=1 Tax=uncultured Tateyamaria sp. TaxID=455651 RepID=UPI00262F50A2|nr:MupA/Atu3671 family FMN-dependent luciferase-like monooxygenase [uncultured Tateyamaria sp.]
MSSFSTILIGHESLVIQCGELLRSEGHAISAVVTRNSDVESWAAGAGLPLVAPGKGLADRLAGMDCDWLLSIANLDIIPDAVLALPKRGAVNFHDGPLPAYAGLNAPVWAALAGETSHGISWHLIEGGVDEGDVLARAEITITPEDTALTLNTKCYGAAIESFPALMAELAKPEPARQKQDLSLRSYFARDARPDVMLDFTKPAADLVRTIRALDHGEYWNPLVLPSFEAGGNLWLARAAHVSESASGAAPGAVLAADGDQLGIATGQGDLVLTRITSTDGNAATPGDIARVGTILQSPSAEAKADVEAVLSPLAKTDPTWRKALEEVTPVDLPLINPASGPAQPLAHTIPVPATVSEDQTRAAFALLMARMTEDARADFALSLPGTHAHLCDWVPVKVEMTDSFAAMTSALAQTMEAARARGPFAADLLARLPGTDPAMPALAFSDTAEAGLIGPSALTLAVTQTGTTLYGDKARIDETALDLYAARLTHLLEHLSSSDDPKALPILPEAERKQTLVDWNATDKPYDPEECVHQAFEAQVERTPGAEALAFEGESLSYAELNAAANRLAHKLIGMGVKPGVTVGLHLPRSSGLLIAALAILKAGGAYLPMDPTYPADRTALFLEDSQAGVVVTNADLAAALPSSTAQILDIAASVADQPDTNPQSSVSGTDLAYMIYTSGSTGRPKGVMVEHRNVANFFVGMDDRIDHTSGGVWLAVTSLSFDISVLELFWTLARGFKLVLSGDENRALVAGDGDTGGGVPGGMEFSLYYWGNDDGRGRDKYRTLLEGAKFADQNGFVAVWTPERHFHAFGGPYPNPSVTGAAVAGATQNIGVRAGSCVAPLHHTARIAEEWAVIDNLTNGKAGMAIASGWQPDDFVLRPENTPPENKPAMFRQIADLRKLWAGEPVAFPRKDGQMHEVVTQPRPISKTPDLWVTTAGNPETWKEAGRNGCHVLTHLLGQSVSEVGDKIKLYHQALREAGHDPARFKVTLMLHTYLAGTRDEAREVAREPMKDYLRSAAGLIKQYAWAFPAFKRPEGVDNAFQLDLGSLTEEELEGILDFAFERYFNDSGLFGTTEDAMAKVAEVKGIGVTEIACLIDYGIEVDTILEALTPLAEVVRAANAGAGPAADDFSIAAQISRHKVTHLQCTPSMARMLVMNDEASAALGSVKHLMLGGEALPGALVSDLNALTDAHIENMYGPTETTIWSTTRTARADAGVVGIGTPIANTQVYILSDALEPQPIGVPGELYIGGDGVTRGYWQRENLTAERFVADPFSAKKGARIYATGDLARWLPSGELDFLGRADFQVKLRGYRIELGEIETAIDALDGVRQSVVLVREDTPGVQQLVAYLLADGSPEEPALKTALAGVLPAHMIPGRFVTLDSFPLTPNKKVDRKALPVPGAPLRAKMVITPTAAAAAKTTSGDGSGFDGDVTAAISGIWTAILGVSDISGRDSFFDLGGHSLLAVQAHREIKAQLGVTRLSITDIFRFPVLADLAAAVEGKLGAASPKPAASTAPAEPARVPEPVGAPAVAAEHPATRADAMAQRRAMRAARRKGG